MKSLFKLRKVAGKAKAEQNDMSRSAPESKRSKALESVTKVDGSMKKKIARASRPDPERIEHAENPSELNEEWELKKEVKTVTKLNALEHEAKAELLTPKPAGLKGSLQAVVQRVRRVRKVRHFESHEEQMLGRLEHVFSEMHQEFDERERVLDKKLQQVVEERKLELQRFKWMSVPIGILSAVGIVYIFYVVYVMEGAMTSMSANMTAMTGDISLMSENTGSMSTNISSVTHSLGNMDYNMAHMTNDVSRMNGSMTSMSQSMQPIGQAANSAAPMMGMMQNFMPF